MAFGAIGLGARLIFDAGRAIAGMTGAGKAALTMSARFAKAKSSAVLMAGGIRTLALAGGVFALALGGMTSKAAAFEQQMANIKAVAVTATKPQLEEMTRLAKELGATTAFSAVQAGEAMEVLTRAGFNANEVLAATPAILDAAAAEGISLAQSADLIAKTVRIMGLEATDAARAADVLALASARSNTTMLGLGEAFKFGGQQAKILGISLEETTAIFAKLADSGLKGSLAGTSFTAMMTKLASPSKKAQAQLKKWNIQLTDSAGKLKPMGDIVNDLSSQLGKNANVIEKSAIAQELFGKRGAKAFAALAEAGGDALKELTIQLQDAQGAARKMAETRLDTFKGQITLLKSAVEGFSIEIGSILLPTLTGGVRKASKFIGDLAVGLGIVFAKPTKDAEALNKRMERWNKIGSIAQAVILGMKEGIDALSAAWNKAIRIIMGVTRAAGANTSMIKEMARVVTIVIGALAIFTPLALATLLAFKLIAAVVSIVVGAFGLLTASAGILVAAFWPIVLVAGALTAVFLLFRRDGESAFDTIKRVAMSTFKFFQGFVKGMAKGMKKMWVPLKIAVLPLWEAFAGAIKNIKKALKVFFKSSGKDAKSWGATIGKVVGVVVVGTLVILAKMLGVVINVFLTLGATIGFVASKIVQGFMFILNTAKAVGSFIAGAFTAVWNGLKGAATSALSGISTAVNFIWSGIKNLATAVKTTLVGAFNAAKGPIISVVNAIKRPIAAVAAFVGKIVGGLNRAIALVKKLASLRKGGGGGPGAGQFGPLPVTPGPTPPSTSAGPVVLPDVKIAGGSSELVVHTHLMLEGREVAVVVERFRTDRKVRATALTPGELREFITATAVA